MLTTSKNLMTDMTQRKMFFAIFCIKEKMMPSNCFSPQQILEFQREMKQTYTRERQMKVHKERSTVLNS
jgi:hypothetical protein